MGLLHVWTKWMLALSQLSEADRGLVGGFFLSMVVILLLEIMADVRQRTGSMPFLPFLVMVGTGVYFGSWVQAIEPEPMLILGGLVGIIIGGIRLFVRVANASKSQRPKWPPKQ